MITFAVELSTLIAMGIYFQHISFKVVQIGTTVCELIKIVPYSASAAYAMMLRVILHRTRIIPLTVGYKYSGFFGLGGPSLRKWTPLARLLAQDTERYDASE